MSAMASSSSPLLPSRGRPRSRAGRIWSERVVRWVLLGCAVFSIVTTFAITMGYVAFANRRLDPLSAEIREDLEKIERGDA